MKKYSFSLLKIATSALFIYLIFMEIGIKEFWANLRISKPYFIFIILFLFVLNYILSGIKGRILLIHQKTNVNLAYLIKLYFTGSFFNNFMPTIIGGDVYKVYKLGKKINNHDNALSVIVMGRIISLLVLIFISLISFLILFGLWGAILLFFYTIFIILGYYILSFLSYRYDLFRKIYNILAFYKGHNRQVIQAVALSLIVQICYVLIQYFLFLSLDIKIPILYAFLVLPVIRFVGFFIPSINGFGVQDILYIKFFALISLPSVLSLCTSVLYHIFKFLVSLIGGIFYALEKED